MGRELRACALQSPPISQSILAADLTHAPTSAPACSAPRFSICPYLGNQSIWRQRKRSPVGASWNAVGEGIRSGPVPSRRGPALPTDPSQMHLKRSVHPANKLRLTRLKFRLQGIAKDPVWLEVGRRREMRSTRSQGWAAWLR